MDFQIQFSKRIPSTIKYHKRDHYATFLCVKLLKNSVRFPLRLSHDAPNVDIKRKVESLKELRHG